MAFGFELSLTSDLCTIGFDPEKTKLIGNALTAEGAARAAAIAAIFTSAGPSIAADWTPTFSVETPGSWAATASVAKVIRIGTFRAFFIAAAGTYTEKPLDPSHWVTFTLPDNKASAGAAIFGDGEIVPDGNNVKDALVRSTGAAGTAYVAFAALANLTTGANVSITVFGFYWAAA